MWVHLVSGTLHELEVRKCAVLPGVIVERREALDAKHGSLQPPSAPADCPLLHVGVPQQLVVLRGSFLAELLGPCKKMHETQEG